MARKLLSIFRFFLFLSMSSLSGARATRNGSTEAISKEYPTALKEVAEMPKKAETTESLPAEGVKQAKCEGKVPDAGVIQEPQAPSSFAEVGTEAARKEPDTSMTEGVSSLVQVSDHQKGTKEDEGGSEEDDHDENEPDEGEHDENEVEEPEALAEISEAGDRADAKEEEDDEHVKVHDSDFTIDEEHSTITGNQTDEEESPCMDTECQVPFAPRGSRFDSSSWKPYCAPLAVQKEGAGNVYGWLSRIRIFEIHHVHNIASINSIKTLDSTVGKVAVTLHRRSDADPKKNRKVPKKLEALLQTDFMIGRDVDFNGFGCPILVNPDDKFELVLWDLSKSKAKCRAQFLMKDNDMIDFTYKGGGESDIFDQEMVSCYPQLGSVEEQMSFSPFGDNGLGTQIRFGIRELYADITGTFGDPTKSLTMCKSMPNEKNAADIPGWCTNPVQPAKKATDKKYHGECPALGTFNNGNWRTWVNSLWILHFGWIQNVYDTGQVQIKFEMDSVDENWNKLRINGKTHFRDLPAADGRKACKKGKECTAMNSAQGLKTFWNFGCPVLLGYSLKIDLKANFNGGFNYDGVPALDCARQLKPNFRNQQAHQSLQICNWKKKRQFNFKKKNRKPGVIEMSAFRMMYDVVDRKEVQQARILNQAQWDLEDKSKMMAQSFVNSTDTGSDNGKDL